MHEMGATRTMTNTIANNLKRLKEANRPDDPAYKVAVDAGIPPSQWYLIASGKSNPRMSTLTKLAAALRCDVAELLEGNNDE